MNKLELLLKENWKLLDELFELPQNIDTKSYGDDFFSRGKYGESFEFHHTITGKSGKQYKMLFRFMRRYLKTDPNAQRTFTHHGKKGQQEVSLPESEIPTYEITFYPEEAEGKSNQWNLLNDISPSQVTIVAGYFALFHASTILKSDVPIPMVDYMFRPFKEKHEKEMSAKDSKRGEFYNRAIPKIFEQLSSQFNNIEVSEVKIEPEYTLVKIKTA